MNDISIIIPSHNNLRHLKNAYKSIKKHASDVEICIADDASSDGTFKWLKSLKDNNLKYIRVEERKGHTILYDTLINEISTKDIIHIFHADMIMSHNYIENMVKHLETATVVSATRIEPPLHPKGKEKIIMDFGIDFDSLDIEGFEQYARKKQKEFKNKTTEGIFAPWMMYKSDFQYINGHDSIFAPFPYEDSDIFNRMLLNGFKFVQSWSALVYHLTCRGHRWNKQIQKDDDDYKKFEINARRNYIRKWGVWIENDEYHKPILYPRFKKSLVLDIGNKKNVDYKSFIKEIEVWFDHISVIHIDDIVQEYINEEQIKTNYNLSNKFNEFDSSVVVSINLDTFNQDDFNIIQNLSKIIQDSGEIGVFSIGNIEIEINKLEDISKSLIINK